MALSFQKLSRRASKRTKPILPFNKNRKSGSFLRIFPMKNEELGKSLGFLVASPEKIGIWGSTRDFPYEKIGSRCRCATVNAPGRSCFLQVCIFQWAELAKEALERRQLGCEGLSPRPFRSCACALTKQKRKNLSQAILFEEKHKSVMLLSKPVSGAPNN